MSSSSASLSSKSNSVLPISVAKRAVAGAGEWRREGSEVAVAVGRKVWSVSAEDEG
jgi:hypothetical protein